MATYKAKSAIISKSGKGDGRKLTRPCTISLFNVSNPHKSGKLPDEILMFDNVEEVILPKSRSRFLLAGSDVLLEGISSISVQKIGKKITINAK